MMLRFGVANHRSIRDYQELFLSASKRIKRKGLVVPVPTLREDAVPIVAIYGANAAGKSNLIGAMDEFRRWIVQSHKSLDANDEISRTPFRLDETSKARPTRFDCTFTVGTRGADKRQPNEPANVYEYGFEFTETEYRREWLYRVARRERQSTQVLFERNTDDGHVRVRFGSQLRGENKTIAKLTRPNSLFLSAAAQNNHSQLTELHGFFSECWMVIPSEGAMNDGAVAARLSDYEHFERLELLVRQADVGIRGIDLEDEELDNDELELMRDLAEVVTKRIDANTESAVTNKALLDKLRNRKRLRFVHSAVGGGIATFDYDLESKGTRTLITLLVPALDALSRGSLLAIDELDTSIHPKLAQAFISLFGKEDSNPHGAQLVFSTHDVALLGSGLVSQDEIWMTDKSHEGMTRFTPLTDFKLRSRDDIEKAYRNGRIGGVPTGDDFFVSFGDSGIPAES